MADKGKMATSESGMFPVRTRKLKVNFSGKLGRNYITPRGLRAPLLNNLVCVQGIVTKMSIVKSKISKSYHYVDTEKTGYVQNYKDQYCIEGQGEFPTRMLPTKDPSGNLMTPEYGY
jgi:DNA replication licensing factor MCM3